ncbi:MAG: ATP-binding protein, partial [Thermomicrobiales bacterium]
RTRALRQYTLLRDALRHELDAAPDAASQRLYHAILTRRFPATSATTLPTADPASRALTAARHNLPTPLTSFVGRGRERAALARRLLPSLGDAVTGPRLITLTGAGGVGKSRLALAVANTLAARYPDGVWLVELATLTDPALVPAAVAAALGVNTPGRPLADTLLEHARSKTLLLVLDNCEHLAGACAQLAGTLLAACPRVSLLATSRLALRVPGEAIWRVSPLEAPDPTQAPTLAVLRDVPAVRLFVERARFVQPDFALSAANAAAVTEICRRLDGLPLAIELAAARLAVLSPMQLATRLDSALGLLGDRDQATPAHQRTLRATLDWSYALLGERERRLLRRLATFVGGWTLEAAEAVAASAEADGLPPRDVLPLLARLVDHSLVGVEARGDAARYQLLETVRQYAAEQLAASGEIIVVEQRHAIYYLALAEAAEPQLTGAAQVGWFDRLEREHANLLTALDNLRAAGATESWARLGVALWRFWETRGHLGEGLRRLETIMAAQDVPAVLRGKASSRAASLLRARGDLARSDTLYRQTLALWQDLGEARGAAVALANLGINAEYRSDVTAAAAFHQESLARFTALDDQRGIAAELNNLANIRADAGGLAEATVLYERAITLAHTLGQPPDAYAIGNLGNIAYRRGDYGRAVTRLEESVALLRQRDDRPMLGHYLRYLGFAWRQYGDPVRAVAAFQEALDIDRALDAHSHWTADVLEGLASLLIAAGHSEDGARLFGAADTVREATTVPRRVFYANLYTHDVAMARAALGETAFATAWAAGRALSWSEAIAAAAIRVEAVTLPAATPPALSPREQQVAALIASGLTNAQIAATLGLSQRTADSHVHHILHKLGATSRATIAAWAANHNPVEAPHEQPLPGMSRHT